MGAVAEAGLDGDGRHALARVAEEPPGVAETQPPVDLTGFGPHRGVEQPLQPPARQAETAGHGIDGERLGDVLLHEEQRPPDPVVASAVADLRVRLRVRPLPGVLELEDVEAFLGGGGADVATNQEGGEVGDAAAARAGDAVPSTRKSWSATGRRPGNSAS